jgi:hypothetical protein
MTAASSPVRQTATSWHNWADALAVANAKAYITGRRQTVRRSSFIWRVTEADA